MASRRSRSRERGGAALAVALAASISCGDPTPRGQPTPAGTGAAKAALGGENVAAVGSQTVSKGLAREVALARKLGPREAVDTLVSEALLAELAVRQKALEDPVVQRKLRAVLARRLVARLRAEAVAEGPWTDAELDAAARASGLWLEIDRPETRIAAHALVRKGAPDPAGLAKKLRAFLLELPATGTAEEQAKAFVAKAQTFPMPDGHALVVERLEDPFTADGRVAVKGPPRGLEVAFAKGAFDVAAVGGTSEIVETSYGVHVIRLLGVFPAKVAPRDQRVTLLEPELVRKRAAPRYQTKLQGLLDAAAPKELASGDDLLLPRALEPR